MDLLVVGSVALDTVKTRSGVRQDLLGGSATHFAVAASFFAGVRLVAVVGDDFTEAHRKPLEDRGVDLAGLARVRGRTFRWSGEYGANLDTPRTVDLQLNVFAGFDPKLPEGWSETGLIFLANIDPDLQLRVLDQATKRLLVAADTRDHWILHKREALARVVSRVDLLLINEEEIRQLTGRGGVVEAAEAAGGMGPGVVVVKRGEHGVLVWTPGQLFSLPAFPVRAVVDPTGAGDAFAGGFLGFLAAHADRAERDYRAAAVLGSVMASFQVEDFSLHRLLRLRPRDILERYEAFRRLTSFGDLPDRTFRGSSP